MLPVTSCYRNRDKLRPDEPPGSYADFTFTFLCIDISVASDVKHRLHFQSSLIQINLLRITQPGLFGLSSGRGRERESAQTKINLDITLSICNFLIS